MTDQATPGETQPSSAGQKAMDYELSALLRQHRDEIAAAWAARIYQLPGFSDPSGVEQTYNLNERALSAMSDVLTTGSYARLEAHLADVNQTCQETGTEIDRVIEGFLLVDDVARPVILSAYPLDSASVWEQTARLSFLTRWMVSFLAKLFVVASSQRLREQQARTATMLEIARAASSTLELGEVLSCVAQSIATVVEVPYCAFYLIDQERDLLIPQFGVGRDLVPTGLTARSLLVSTASTFVRQVLERKAPLASCDAQNDARMDREEIERSRFKSVLAVPFVVKEQVLAVAFAGTREEIRDFIPEQVELAWGVANTVAPAIENAWLHQKLKQMAIVEERNRLAREMHDNLAQALGVLQLKASQIAEALTDDNAHNDLLELQALISEINTDVRETIFNMRTMASPVAGLLPTLQDYLGVYCARYGVDVYLEADGEPELDLSGETGSQVVRIIQEALTNARKHAGASQARICVRQVGDRVSISVRDGGCGFDPALVTGRDRRHVGLQVMRERAESIGGTLEIESSPGQGTRVTLSLPSSSNRERL